ncbi:histidine-rich protein PFHRP-II-like, partial [Musca vetustissima]|uniref:histidine-rich protein PFHRP-II-like n=1 Tax=Musca vetustissima TaxID=27455 RepID=UPI002AB7F1CF
MKVFTCILALAVASVQAGFWPQADQPVVHHGGDIHHGLVVDTHHVEQHPVYHHAEQTAIADIGFVDNHHGVVAEDVRNVPAVKVIQHEPIHQVEPVHHVTKVLHHEPHHFLHYTNPVVDHHVIHNNHHIDEHHHAADLHHSELHHGDVAHNGEVVHHGDVHHAAVLHHGDVLHHDGILDHAGVVHHPDVNNHAAVVYHADIHKHSAIVHHVKPTYHHSGAVVTKIYPSKVYGHVAKDFGKVK